jgi:hexosaminidase
MLWRWLLAAALLLTQTLVAESAELPVIPMPQRVEPLSGSFDVDKQTKLMIGDPRAEAAARYFGDLLMQSRGFRPETAQSTASQPDKKSILFTLDPEASPLSPEGYDLEISGKSIRLAASDPRGLMYGAITLWQLLSGSAGKDDEISVSAMRIKDAPRLQWRGLLLDSARSYQSVAFIKRFIDTMALHKLNLLHWHLVDDQAWRLEIRKFPKLTEGRETTSYTQAQVREIVEHAAKRNVTLIPGLEMPGHATAAVLAYPQLGTAAPVTGRAEPGNLYNVEDSTFGFFEAVFGEIAELFPGPFVHIGGSDVSKEQWQASPSVQARMKQLGIPNEQRLQRYFFERIASLLTQRNRRMIGWDGALSGSLAANSIISTAKGIDGALVAAASGYDVIVSSSALNLDRRQASAAPGQFVSDRLVSLEDIYNFDPIPAALTEQERRRMVGMQANIWTNAMDTEERVENLAFPRAAALAEVAWSAPARGRWSSFLQRLAPQLNRYASLGVRYSDAAFRVMVIPRGMKSTDRVRIELAKQTPLGEIRYTVNGTELSPRSNAYSDVFEVNMPAVVKATTYLNGVPLATEVSMQVDRTTMAQLPTTGGN